MSEASKNRGYTINTNNIIVFLSGVIVFEALFRVIGFGNFIRNTFFEVINDHTNIVVPVINNFLTSSVILIIFAPIFIISSFKISLEHKSFNFSAYSAFIGVAIILTDIIFMYLPFGLITEGFWSGYFLLIALRAAAICSITTLIYEKFFSFA